MRERLVSYETQVLYVKEIHTAPSNDPAEYLWQITLALQIVCSMPCDEMKSSKLYTTSPQGVADVHLFKELLKM